MFRRKRKDQPVEVARERRPDVNHDIGWGGPDCTPPVVDHLLVEGMLWTCECGAISRFDGETWSRWT